MSIVIRGRKFHYRFQFQGKEYSGPCEGCEVPHDAKTREVNAIRKKALEIEAAEKSRLAKEAQERTELERDVRKNKSVQALVENYKYELTGGKPITLQEACHLAAAKPARHIPSERYREQRHSYWHDFTAFMELAYPDVTTLTNVRRMHCEAFVKHLIEHGRFVKAIIYRDERVLRESKTISYQKNYGLSPKTIKEIVCICKWVFRQLTEDAGIVFDPWNGIQLPEPAPIDREIFTPEELKLIWEGIQSNPFCYPLFIVAANSGMTEGDICTLKWSEIEWNTGYIRRKRRKTGANIKLPLLPQLADYLRSLPQTGEYVFPEHAELYLRCSSLVSARVKAFLSGLGIVTTAEVENRRAVSIKDLHSMRHVFCYRAKRAGIPESIIAKFVGHKVIAMTQHYANHDTDEELRAEIQKLPPLFVGEYAVPNGEELRQKLAQLAYSLPLDKIKSLLSVEVL